MHAREMHRNSGLGWRDARCREVGWGQPACQDCQRQVHLCPPPARRRRSPAARRQFASCIVPGGLLNTHSPQHVAQIFDGLPQPSLRVLLVHDVTGLAVVHGLGHAVAVVSSPSGAPASSGSVGSAGGGGEGPGDGEGRGVLRVSLLLQLLALSPVELGLSLLFESEAGLGKGGSVRSTVAFSGP